ncbi:MAG TPA: GTP-binding protein [Rhodopila sp.]
MLQSDDRDRFDSVPVTVITGFLGSGKTTVLNRLLRVPKLADTAVIINEFGEVSLDHLLIEQAIENAVLLKNGCICCTVRGDILDTVNELFRKRETGELPWFRRIAIETTGLADPAPVVHTLLDTDQPCHMDGIVVTADAIHIRAQLDQQEEARNQVALADRILLTKTDLVTRAEVDVVEPMIRAFNAQAPIRRIVDGDVTPDDVFGLGPEQRPANWLRPAVREHDHDHAHHHHHGIASVVLRAEQPVPWPALALWLDSLLSLHGADVLRLKGIVRVAGVARPVVVQAVHHVLHMLVTLPPEAEAAWGGPGSEIVVIQRGLPEAGLHASFAAALSERSTRVA